MSAGGASPLPALLQGLQKNVRARWYPGCLAADERWLRLTNYADAVSPRLTPNSSDERRAPPVDQIRQISDGGDDYAERDSVAPQFNQPGGDTEPAAKRGARTLPCAPPMRSAKSQRSIRDGSAEPFRDRIVKVLQRRAGVRA
jgi:hypothetical protein